MPLLLLIAGTFLGLKVIYLRLYRTSYTPVIETRLHHIPFSFISSLLFLFGLHGANFIKIIIIMSINFGIAKSLKRSKLLPFITWGFNMAVLFAIERNSGYKFANLSSSLAFLVRKISYVTEHIFL